MRLGVAAGIVFLLAALAAAALVAANLRALANARGVELIRRAERSLGRELAVARVEASFWPIGIRLSEVAIGEDPRFGAGQFLTAPGLVLTVRPWSLLRGRIAMGGVVLERPRVMIVRDREGWNVASLGARAARSDTARPDGRRRGPRLSLPLQWIVGIARGEIRDGTVEVVDRTGGAERRVAIRRVDGRARDLRLGARPHVTLAAATFGEARQDTQLDLRLGRLGESEARRTPFVGRLELAGADLALLAKFGGFGRGLGGRVDHVVLDVTGTLERWLATVDVRVGAATLRLGRQAFVPPASELALRVARDRTRVTLEEGRGRVGGLRFTAEGEGTLDPWQARLAVRAVAGTAVAVPLGSTAPALADLALDLALDAAGVRFETARATLDGAPLTLAGRVTQVAPPAAALAFAATALGGSLAADLRLAPTGAFALDLRAAELALPALAARLAPAVAADVDGRLAGTAALTATIAHGRVAPGSLAGDGTLVITDGRLRDLNLATEVLAPARVLPFMPRLVSRRARERSRELFGPTDTRFAAVTVPVRLAEGRLFVGPTVAATRGYEVACEGWIDARRRIRLHGDLRLGPAVSRTLRRDVAAARYLTGDDGRVAVPFRVRGEIGHARIAPDAKRLRARGLQVLLDASRAQPTEEAPRPRAPLRPAPERPLEDAILDQLERMIRP